MNLSPDWVAAFTANKIESVHWSSIGAPNAKDSEIIEYAKHNDYVVFTHDLDFGTLLALTQAKSPSVIQVRSQDILPDRLANRLTKVLRENRSMLEMGALIVVDETRERNSHSSTAKLQLSITMCRNIKTLFNFEPPATSDEVRASSLQFVRKLSGFNKPSKANEVAFDLAVERVSAAAQELLDSLVTTAEPRDRETEAARAKAKAAQRFG